MPDTFEHVKFDCATGEEVRVPYTAAETKARRQAIAEAVAAQSAQAEAVAELEAAREVLAQQVDRHRPDPHDADFKAAVATVLLAAP